MGKVYDIVETSKMAYEYVGSMIDVEGVAETNLENGRLVVIKDDGKVAYADSTTTSGVKLHISVEVMADTSKGLTEFRKLAGEKVRTTNMQVGDTYKTTAFTGTLVQNDKVVLGDNGILVKGTPVGTEAFIGRVKEVTSLGFSSNSYGFDRIPAIKVEVLQVK